MFPPRDAPHIAPNLPGAGAESVSSSAPAYGVGQLVLLVRLATTHGPARSPPSTAPPTAPVTPSLSPSRAEMGTERDDARTRGAAWKARALEARKASALEQSARVATASRMDGTPREESQGIRRAEQSQGVKESGQWQRIS